MRNCIVCGSSTTYVDKRGCSQWYNHDGWHCSRCHNRLFLNPKWHPITRKWKVMFKGKWRYVGRNPRVGKCSRCGKGIGDIYINKFGKEAKIKIMHMHHIEYHDDDPLRDTFELCPSCHGKESYRLKQGIYSFNQKRTLRITSLVK